VLCLARPPSILPAPVRSDRVMVNGGLTQVEFFLGILRCHGNARCPAANVQARTSSNNPGSQGGPGPVLDRDCVFGHHALGKRQRPRGGRKAAQCRFPSFQFCSERSFWSTFDGILLQQSTRWLAIPGVFADRTRGSGATVRGRVRTAGPMSERSGLAGASARRPHLGKRAKRVDVANFGRRLEQCRHR